MIRVRFQNVSKYYSLYRSDGIKNFIINFGSSIRGFYSNRFLVLDNVSFEIEDKDVVGIIGKNGAGKSTTLGLIARVLSPSEGRVFINGCIAPLLELGAGFHPDLTGRENIILNGILLGMTRKEILYKIDSIIEFSEIGDFIDQPIRLYSSGMKSRLGFSVAVHIDPDILLIDEVLSVGDHSFQEKSKNMIYEFKKKGKTIVFVSHDISLVKELCNKVILLHDHRLVYQGDVANGVDIYEKL